MAQMETDGIEEAIRQLNKADLFTDENVKRMLTAGSEVMLTSVKSAFVESGHNNPGRQRRTGETLRHITKARVVRKDKNGVPYMFVTIHGKDKRGQRYGTKGILLVDRGTQHLAAGQRQNVRRRCRHSERRMTCLNLIFAA